MIPVLAAIGVSMLGTLAEKSVRALIEGHLGGETAIDSAKRSFNAVLERSRATTSARSNVRHADPFPSPGLAPSVVGGSAEDASVGLLTAQLATQRTRSPLTALLATPQRPVSPRMATDLIGRKIAANGSVVELRGPIPPTLQYRLPAAAASVQIEVQDLQGTVVRSIRLGSKPGGFHQLPFDGRGLSSGLYLYRVIATDAAGQPITRVSTASGRVTGVQFESGHPFLNVGSARVPLTGIFEVSGIQQSAHS